VALPGYFHELAAKVRNWGRWGSDDEIGTLNLIDGDAVRRGLACARAGRTFSLAYPLMADGIQLGFIPGRVNPELELHQVNEPLSDDPDAACVNDDHVTLGLQAATHWDALAHVSYGGQLYNGFPASAVTAAGATRCGIDKVGPILSRGVLLDVARARGLERLEGGYAITADDLDAAAALARLSVASGDIVLVRTGQMHWLTEAQPVDKLRYAYPSPGLSMNTVEWLRGHDVAAVATDTLVFEVFPWEDPAVTMPVHLLHLVDMGMTQGQNWVLDELAADCASDGVYEFLLEATPQPFAGAVGSPVNPVAVK
jgi:kynurenine formamidase